MDVSRRLILLASLSIGLATVFSTGRCLGQQTLTIRAVPIPVQAAEGREIPAEVFAAPPADPESKASAADAEANTEEQKKQQRLQKIQQLTFDRRPSSILKAWATPKEEAEEPEPEPAKAEDKPDTDAPKDQDDEPDTFDADIKALQRFVTLGDWAAVKAFVAELPEEEGTALYRRLIQILPSAAGGLAPLLPSDLPPGIVMPQQMQNQQFNEKNTFSSADILGLAAAAPIDLDDPLISGLGRLLRMSLEQGNDVEDFVLQVKAEQDQSEDEAALTDREAARILIAAGKAVEAGTFLPDPETAEADNDREALNLLSQHFMALHAKEKKVVHLEQAWKVTQAALAVGEVDESQKSAALKRAVELAPKIRDELGEAWLQESFTARPERGMEIIAAIGASASQGLQAQPMDPAFRLKSLELQQTAVEALLKSAPERADDWNDSLTLLALAWLTEAEFSRRYDQSTSLGPRIQRDPFGNIFYVNSDDGSPQPYMPQQGNMPRAIRVGDVLKVKPGAAWLEVVDPALRPRFATIYAQLYLKVQEEAEAFPSIEQLAQTHPEQAKELAEEFLRVWTRNHDPNASRNQTNPYMFMYGFERRAESIPLTRSKQERNLEELADWVARLKDLPIGEIDEQLLARAFTTSHSVAEVYRVEAIEKVFGSLDALEPETLAELIQQMRANLMSVWREPAVQEQNKTRRRERDIRAEVFRGYDVARAVLEQGLTRHPDHWALVLARAAILHDENNYRNEIDLSSEFVPNRQAAFREFQRAAQLYARQVADLAEEDQSNNVFDIWFYASLGACDLNQIAENHQADRSQPPLIREAIEALPGEAADRHLGNFANALFTRMSSASPSVKVRYLEGGFEIIGDHEQAREARKVHEYYKDLITEIKLVARIDGGDEVGHEQPFGLFVDLRHTREIERESGGFGRYLQNQNTNNTYYYNYGRPLENYRDKFEEAVLQALQEHFDILSVTFQSEAVNSKAAETYGWRITPYAYLLLKARGPEVDKIPPLRLDLDFLDTSGYVILPIESPAVPLDASPSQGSARPFEELAITQTLDERQAKDGKLILEVKAVAQGLVPDLDEVLDVSSEGFEIVEVEDQGLSVSRFAPETDETVVESERQWLVHFRADPALAERPEVFHFARARTDTMDLSYQRYVDADLAAAEPTIRLEEQYGQTRNAGLWWILGIALALALVVVLVIRFRPRRVSAEAQRFPLPDPITPFTVLGLLRDIEANNGLQSAQKRELAQSIQHLEQHYFVESNGSGPTETIDLQKVAERWVRQTA